MTIIQVLDEKTANQIKAGEVIERPASVVKELLENAIDAKAKHIDIFIEAGGQKQITVVDDGIGMASDDAVLSLSRHATSKLRVVDDLNQLQSFGFRGEALPSIASVAKLKIITRPAEKKVATSIEVFGGSIERIDEKGAPFGTRIEIEDLFFNVPARLKFLKAERTESVLIESMVKNFCLMYPSVGFKLTNNGKSQIIAPALPAETPMDDPRYLKRVEQALGKEVSGYLFPINFTTDSIELKGYIVAPLVTRRDNRGVRLFVNGRSVVDKELIQVVKVAYRSLLEVGRNPICVLNIILPPAEVDVNAHPQKLEVRFREPRRVHAHIIRLLSDFLAETPWQTFPTPPEKKDAARMQFSMNAFEPKRVINHEYLAKAPAQNDFLQSSLHKILTPVVNANTPEQSTLIDQSDITQFKYLGQIDSTFLLLDSGCGLYVVDQHAAHERVLFEKIKAEHNLKGYLAQKLLVTIQVALDSDEMATLDEYFAQLGELGFELDLFGPNSIMIKSVPQQLSLKAPELFLKDLLSDFFHHGRCDAVLDKRDQLCATLACHSSIRAGQVLNEPEVKSLLESLRGTPMQAHCPHGRPVAHMLTLKEIKGWFDRP